MNNTCPSCGAIYNVAAKDIGRRIKCKKCSAALVVTEAGLEEEGATSAAPAGRSAPAPVSEDADYDDAPPVERKKKRDRPAGPGLNPLAMLEKIGGLPTILFAFGVFLVVVFTSFPIIGGASTRRANAYVDQLKLEQATEIKDLAKGKKNGELTSEEQNRINDDSKKIVEKYEKRISEASLSAERTKISNIRDEWLERYGLMFGFIFVSFGCIGYLRTEQPLVLKITAAVILAVMMIAMFGTFTVGGCSRGPVP